MKEINFGRLQKFKIILQEFDLEDSVPGSCSWDCFLMNSLRAALFKQNQDKTLKPPHNITHNSTHSDLIHTHI